MRKITFLTFLATIFMLISQQGQAQKTEKKEERLRLGVKGSFNISTLNNIKGSNLDNANFGFSVGMFAKLPLVHRVAIQPELYFTTKGASVKYNNLLVAGTTKYNLNYIEIPVLVVYNFTPNFNAHLGPYAGILVSGNAKNVTGNTLFDFEKNIDVDNYNRIDAGIAGGVGIDIGAITIGLRYSQGLTKVGKEKSYVGFNYTFPDAVNGVVSAFIHFSLN
jgi:hypothetical protein